MFYADSKYTSNLKKRKNNLIIELHVLHEYLHA